MNKDDLVFVTHILESIEHIEEFTKGMTKSDFLRSEMVQAAVIRKLEIVGEATKNIKRTFRKKYLEIPWENMAGMRDKLIHDYMGVDLKIVWVVVKKELPSLKKQVQHILEEGLK